MFVNAQTQGPVEICMLNAFATYLTTGFVDLLWAYESVHEYPLPSVQNQLGAEFHSFPLRYKTASCQCFVTANKKTELNHLQWYLN